MDAELVKISHLNLRLDGIDICPDTSFSLAKHRGYLITGPFENINIFLLKVIGGILPPPLEPRQPMVLFRGKDLYESTEEEIIELKKKMSFVFCEGTLISNLTVEENLLLPLRYHYPDYDRAAVMAKIKEDFDFFGIPAVLEKRPAEISFYLKKKLAFIRASLPEPELMLMDKPLFNLDEQDRQQVVRYLENLKNKGAAFIIVSRCVPVLEPLIDEAIILEEGKKPAFIGKTDKRFANLSRCLYDYKFPGEKNEL